jgi:hypothetical protein
MIHNKTRAREQGVETHLTNLPHTDFLCRSCGCRLCWPSGSSMELWLLLWDRRGEGKSMSSRSLYRSGGPKAKDRLSLELWLPILSCVTPSLLQGNHTYIRYITGMLCYKQRRDNTILTSKQSSMNLDKKSTTLLPILRHCTAGVENQVGIFTHKWAIGISFLVA